jgi:hypothetical protein
MTGFRNWAAAATIAVAVAGCGVGEGEASDGEATLTVTRDYGSTPVLEAEIDDPTESETVMRALDREAEVETRYGGGFVDSIEGIEGSAVEDGRSSDWFFYVNGIESSVGAAEVPVSAGDRIWWDHRDWTDAMRVPAVVGSWPEPFVHDQDTELLVGTWSKIRDDEAARLLAAGPERSGVFAEANDELGELTALDERGRPAARLGPGTGLVAAVREGEGAATWIVTGADPVGLEAAADLLDDDILRDRYAVASLRGEPLPLPVDPDAGA